MKLKDLKLEDDTIYKFINDKNCDCYFRIKNNQIVSLTPCNITPLGGTCLLYESDRFRKITDKDYAKVFKYLMNYRVSK